MITQRYLKRYWWIVAIIIALIAVSTYFDLLIPEYLSKLLDSVEAGRDFTGPALSMLMAVIASLAISLVMAVALGYLLSSVTYDMRNDIFTKISGFSETEMSRFSVGSLTTRTINDANRIRVVLGMMLVAFIRAPILFTIALSKMTDMELTWNLVLIAFSVALVVGILIFLMTVVPMLKKLQRYMDEMTTVTNDGLSGICEIRSYNGESFQHGKYDAVNEKITGANSVIRQGTATLNAFAPICINMLTVVIYLMAAYAIDSFTGTVVQMKTLNEMIVFSTYATMIFTAITALFSSVVYYPLAKISGERIAEILSTENTMDNGTTKGTERNDGSIVFDNVSFRYPGNNHDTLSDIDLELGPGQKLGIIGQTGSGKSTLVNLIARLYDVTEGSLKIDGIDVRDYDIDSLHSKIGYVPQRSVLLNRSISDNVRFGDTHDLRTMDDVMEAIRIANAKDFVEADSDGYEHIVKEGGSNLSGGQRQRICIARAICKRPEIYIFDDCFSALDYKTDYLVRNTLARETAGITTVIVSHRVSTIIDSDIIIVMNNGRIVGKGTHPQLLETCDEYREIFKTQFPGGVHDDG